MIAKDYKALRVDMVINIVYFALIIIVHATTIYK